MRYALSVLMLILFACDIEPEGQEDIIGCCDELAWNYNPDTTIHDNSLCIYDFEFSNPTDSSIWIIGETQTISWIGGVSDLNVRIAMHDADSDNEVLISESAPNTGSYEWVVDVGDFDLGNKRIYFIQDIDSDNLISYSDIFIVESNSFFS